MIYKLLTLIYYKHTEKDMVCCPEICWCWKLNTIILKVEMRKDKKGKLNQ